MLCVEQTNLVTQADWGFAILRYCTVHLNLTGAGYCWTWLSLKPLENIEAKTEAPLWWWELTAHVLYAFMRASLKWINSHQVHEIQVQHHPLWNPLKASDNSSNLEEALCCVCVSGPCALSPPTIVSFQGITCATQSKCLKWAVHEIGEKETGWDWQRETQTIRHIHFNGGMAFKRKKNNLVTPYV